MWAHGIVMPTSTFHDDPGLGEREEDLTVEQFIAQADVEALDIAFLPR